ncbi:helix-turn-helix domain-containing protein [Parathalassolituus penaei]|uniref:Helix-turn-helix domain-containing protein n=1 Tax=Parathalassolituus penaei TaxID=2997323 RepID=A0A9X3EHQ7_9GAMM|nr:helix-turn-helix domain-containing protein [Parathalassolituus penaei]MCY0967391.1 helix-turn-helix domain-containing protein [Parathalassolituus penaei]
MQCFLDGQPPCQWPASWNWQRLGQRDYLRISSDSVQTLKGRMPCGQLFLLGCLQGQVEWLPAGTGALENAHSGRLADHDVVQRVCAGEVRVLNASAVLHLQVLAGSVLLLVRIPVSELQASARELGLYCGGKPLQLGACAHDSRAMRSLLLLLEDGLLYGGQPLWRQALDCQQRLCDTLLLQGWPHSLSLSFSSRPLQAAALQKARRWILDHIGDDIGIEEMAAAAAVSARTLYNLFRRETGLTPAAYLRALRIEQVHLALRQGGDATVTELAMAFGFTNPGRFARQYQQQMGELPSVTRRGRGN